MIFYAGITICVLMQSNFTVFKTGMAYSSFDEDL